MDGNMTIVSSFVISPSHLLIIFCDVITIQFWLLIVAKIFLEEVPAYASFLYQVLVFLTFKLMSRSRILVQKSLKNVTFH